MKRELVPREVTFNLEIVDDKNIKDLKDIEEFKTPYKKIKRALNIEKEGYNLYIIDTFSNEKINELKSFIEEEYKSLKPPSDICYVTLKEDKNPFPIFLTNGRGKELKEEVANLKEEYLLKVLEFHNTSSDDEKDKIIDNVHLERGKYVTELVKMSKKEGFDVKATSGGFAFIPLENGEVMSEKTYDDLSVEDKDIILKKASELKEKAEDVLEKLKIMEIEVLERLKVIFKEYLEEKMRDLKEDLLLDFIIDDFAYDYLENLYNDIEEDLVENYSIDLDEENLLEEIISKYDFEVIVDNTENEHPRVIYEDNPNLINLLGNIEYESKNGNYITDLSLISPGSLLKANEGCLILRLNDLLVNQNSYYYLKKTLLSEKLSFDSNRNYLELLSINGIKPREIPINLKVIIIGDYESYNILYNNDEDFKKLFSLRCEGISVVRKYKDKSYLLYKLIKERGEKGKLKDISKEGIKSLMRFLTRKTGSREDINIERDEIDNILVQANEIAKEENSEIIEVSHINNVIYEKNIIEDEYMDMYREHKMILKLNGKMVGNINGLAVLDTGLHTFGQPMRITCLAVKGNGNILDVHKNSRLSGKIHEKSISILDGIFKNLVSKYEVPSIDMHLSFEQSYGLIDGDSASVAEMIAILSSISGRGIKQNIAVTGSLNQFKEVQPIGGVNEKIEGFFNVCKEIDKVNGKGVLIPSSNKDDLILNEEVEKAVESGEFHIYTMDSLDDAIETLILEEDESLVDFYNELKEEVLKFKNK